jgi:hypothetical protein
MLAKRSEPSAQTALLDQEVEADAQEVDVITAQDMVSSSPLSDFNQVEGRQLVSPPKMLSFTDSAESVLEQYGDIAACVRVDHSVKLRA